MSTPYTPTPAPLPASLDLPQDAVESLVVETVNTNTAALADAVKNAEQNVLMLQVATRTGFGRFGIDDVVYAADDNYELTVEEASTGPSRNSVSLGTAAPDGDYIALGSAPSVFSRGWWRISFDATPDSSGGAGSVLSLSLWSHPGSTVPTDGTLVGSWRSTVASASGSTVLKGEYLFYVADVSPTPRFTFRVPPGTDSHDYTGLAAVYRRVYVEQVSMDLPTP